MLGEAQTSLRRTAEPVWLGLSLVGFGGLLYLALNFTGTGSDARSYYGIDLANPYVSAVGNLSVDVAFRYGPPLALLLAPLGALSYPAFHLLWFALGLLALYAVCGRWTFAALAFYPVLLELSVGNIHLLLAAALVWGLRYPALWAFLPVTKVTPGVVWVWFLVRREWRNLAIATAATVTLSVASWIVAPWLWPQWFGMLESNVGAPFGVALPVPLWVRLPLALILVAWGARTDRQWALPIGLLLSIPTLWPQAFAVLVATLRLLPRVDDDARVERRTIVRGHGEVDVVGGDEVVGRDGVKQDPVVPVA